MSDAIYHLLIAARKITAQAQRLAEAENQKATAVVCRDASDALTAGIAYQKPGTGEVFACERTSR